MTWLQDRKRFYGLLPIIWWCHLQQQLSVAINDGSTSVGDAESIQLMVGCGNATMTTRSTPRCPAGSPKPQEYSWMAQPILLRSRRTPPPNNRILSRHPTDKTSTTKSSRRIKKVHQPCATHFLTCFGAWTCMEQTLRPSTCDMP